MQRTDFVDKIKSLGFNVRYDLDELTVEDKDDFTHAVISEEAPFMIDTDFPHYIDNEWEKIDKIMWKDLFDVIVEYASTPLEERENKSYFVVVGKKMVYHSERNGEVTFSVSENGFRELNAKIFSDKVEAEEVRARVGGELVDAKKYLETEEIEDRYRWHFVEVDGKTELTLVYVVPRGWGIKGS